MSKKEISKTALDNVEKALKLLKKDPKALKNAAVRANRYALGAELRDFERQSAVITPCSDDQADAVATQMLVLLRMGGIEITRKEGYIVGELLTLLYKYGPSVNLNHTEKLLHKANELFGCDMKDEPSEHTTSHTEKYPDVTHLVMVEGRGVPTVEHHSLESAMTEAVRLVAKENRTAVVASKIAIISPGKPEIDLLIEPQGE
jgi:hypothetical protein